MVYFDITVNNHYVFIKLWYQKGIRVIGDFLDENGRFLKYDFFLRFCPLHDIVHVQIVNIIVLLLQLQNI